MDDSYIHVPLQGFMNVMGSCQVYTDGYRFIMNIVLLHIHVDGESEDIKVYTERPYQNADVNTHIRNYQKLNIHYPGISTYAECDHDLNKIPMDGNSNFE